MVATDGYVLGHTDAELKRLATQARLIDPITRLFLIEAGIGNGMRVLDVGSGAGDVAFLAANLVGLAGQVVGVDRSASALARARTRAEEQSLNNVTFRESELSAITSDNVSMRRSAAMCCVSSQTQFHSCDQSQTWCVPAESSCSTRRTASKCALSHRRLL